MIFRCGTKFALIVLLATGHWTRHWLVMDRIKKFTADHVMENILDPKDLDMDTRPLWSLPKENLQFCCKYY